MDINLGGSVFALSCFMPGRVCSDLLSFAASFQVCGGINKSQAESEASPRVFLWGFNVEHKIYGFIGVHPFASGATLWSPIPRGSKWTNVSSWQWILC